MNLLFLSINLNDSLFLAENDRNRYNLKLQTEEILQQDSQDSHCLFL